MRNYEKYLLGIIIAFISVFGFINGVTFMQDKNKKERKLTHDSLVHNRILEEFKSVNYMDSLTFQSFDAYVDQSNEKIDTILIYLRQIKDKTNYISKNIFHKETLKDNKDASFINLAIYLQLQELNNQMRLFLTSKQR